MSGPIKSNASHRTKAKEAFRILHVHPKAISIDAHVRNDNRGKLKSCFDCWQFILRFLLREEELLANIAELAADGNFKEIQMSYLPYVHEQLYSDIFEKTPLSTQRPRVFAAQLNIFVF